MDILFSNLMCLKLKMGRKDLNDFDKGNLGWLDEWVRTSPKLQVLLGVSGLQWLVRLIDVITEGRLDWAAQSHRRATVAQIADKVSAGLDRKVSEQTIGVFGS